MSDRVKAEIATIEAPPIYRIAHQMPSMVDEFKLANVTLQDVCPNIVSDYGQCILPPPMYRITYSPLAYPFTADVGALPLEFILLMTINPIDIKGESASSTVLPRVLTSIDDRSKQWWWVQELLAATKLRQRLAWARWAFYSCAALKCHDILWRDGRPKTLMENCTPLLYDFIPAAQDFARHVGLFKRNQGDDDPSDESQSVFKTMEMFPLSA